MVRTKHFAHWNYYSTNLRKTKKRGKIQKSFRRYDSWESACPKKKIDTRSTASERAENKKMVLSSLS